MVLTIRKQTNAITTKFMSATMTVPAGHELIESTFAALSAGSRALVITNVTTVPTTLPNAPAITTAIAKSTTFPLLMKALKSEKRLDFLAIDEILNFLSIVI